MLIGGLQKTSMLDYPEKIAAIVFTQGCNFRCGYCHNPELLDIKDKKDIKDINVHAPAQISVSAFFDFLKTRQGKLDGIVITGGEPCLQKDLTDFIIEIKKLGFLVKLDSNGCFPEKIEELLSKKLIDYIAMDIKAPLEKYHKITGTIVKAENILKSINLIMQSKIGYEFRTTVIKSQLSFEDFDKIGDLINGADKYYLQKFVPSKIYNQALMNETSYSNDEFKEIIKKLKTKIKLVELR